MFENAGGGRGAPGRRAAPAGIGGARMASFTVVCVTENRSRETCIAMMSTAHGSELNVFSTNDNHRYVATVDTLRGIAPDEILISESCKQRVLTRRICAAFREAGGGDASAAKIAYVSRTLYDQDAGAEMLRRVLTDGTVDEDVLSRYIVLAACHCLLKYIESTSGTHFASNSVRLRLDPTSSFRANEQLAIDRRSALALELVMNARSGDRRECLFGKMNRTRTTVGARLLRSYLLSPSASIATITVRQDAVQALLEDGELSRILGEQLALFPNLDRMANGLARVPKNVTTHAAEQSIATLIALNETLQLAPVLATLLRGRPAVGRSELLRTVTGTLSDPALGDIGDLVSEILVSPASQPRRNAEEMLDAACFAVRPGYSGMLDLARRALLQSVEDIYASAEALSLEHDVSIAVRYSSTRGFHLSIPLRRQNVDALSPAFIQVSRSKRTLSCSTEEVASLSQRVRESTQEVLLLTHSLIGQAMDGIRAGRIDAVYALIDAVAALDVACSFAELVETEPVTYTRPGLAEEGPLVIKQGRHPITSQQGEAFVPTDVMASRFTNFQIVTGANGAGKTTLVKQVALLVIMAQAGCWCPADFVVVPVRDRICVRMGSSDDLENNLSSFLMEMRDVAYVLDNVTDRSLVLIDELGRGTSHREGIAIAWAVSEELIRAKAYSFFITHYHHLTCLSKMYPSCKNVHLAATLREGRGGEAEMSYERVVLEGPSGFDSGYGIALAERCGFPESVLHDARDLRARLLASDGFNEAPLIDVEDSPDMELLHYVLQRLCVLKDSTLPDEALLKYLDDLRRTWTDEDVAALRSLVDELLPDDAASDGSS